MKGTRWRTLVGTLLVLLLGASAAYSANVADLRDRFPPPATRTDAAPAGRTAGQEVAGSAPGLRSFPWWQPVTAFAGDGADRTATFEIAANALQWRVVWDCFEAPLIVHALDESGDLEDRAIVDEDECPALGSGFSVQPGTWSLDVRAGGRWQLKVEQQLDVPLIEPATAEMEAGEVIASGEFEAIERTGEGTFDVFRLEDGSQVLRLEDFYVTPNVDLEIQVSDAADPSDTEDFTSSKRTRLTMLPVTTGEMNFEVPEEIDVTEWKSLVVYCEPLNIAYIKARISRPAK